MSSPTARAAVLGSAFERNVLLLDGKESRQLARAAAMRQAGATVQCVTTGEAARAAWKPGSHQLVIIEWEGAGADARQFYDYARALSPEQAFAFYTNEPPYLSRTPEGGSRRSADASAPRRAAAGRGWERTLGEATQRIAVVHASPRSAAAPANAARPSFSDAVRAAEDEAEKKARERSY